MNRHRLPAWFWAIGVLSLLLTAGLALNLSPWLRGDLDWRWHYAPLAIRARVTGVALLTTLYLGAAVGLWRWAGWGANLQRAWWVVAFAFIAGLAIQIGVQAVPNPDPLSELMLRTTSPFLAGYHETALGVGAVGDYLRRFPELAPGYLPHTQRHPPGLILYFMGVERLLARFPQLAATAARLLHFYRCDYWPLLYVGDVQFAAAAGGLLSLPLNAAAVFPLFAAGRRLLGERAALGAALLSPLVPGYALWAGNWDQAFVLVTALLLWLLCLALHQRRRWAWWAAGALISVASFFTHAMLVLAAFAGSYTLIHLWLERDYWKTRAGRVASNGLGFVVGLSSVWLVYWLAFGVTFLDVFRANTADHFAMTTHYVMRLFYNPYDFVLFLGFGLGLLGLVAVWQVGRAIAARGSLSTAHVLVLTATLTLAALTLSGASRAEVGRVWLFLMPLTVLAAFAVEGGPAHSAGRWLITAALLGGQTLVMQASLELSERSASHVYALPAWATPVGARVGEHIELAGYELNPFQSQPGGAVNLTLYWRARETPAANYTTFTHVFESGLGLAAQHDGPTREGRYPTSCWRPGEVVADTVALTIGPQAAPGVYHLIVGMYDPATPNHQRLPTEGPGARDMAIVLTEIVVSSSE